MDRHINACILLDTLLSQESYIAEIPHFRKDTPVKVLTIIAEICTLVCRCGSAHVMLWDKSEQASHRLSLLHNI